MPFSLNQPSEIREALRQAVAFLEKHGHPEAQLGAELLLSHELGCARLALPLRQKEVPSAAARRNFEAGIERAAAGEPAQYILGNAGFMGHVFRVDRRALIPRPETEQLVEAVLACAPLWALPRPAIADAGAGSGCIVISLALARPEGRYFAGDLDPAALALARENAEHHGVGGRIRFAVGDLLSDLAPGSLDAVVSNPPYVRTGDWRKLPRMIRDHEPRAALDGGTDGLEVIRPLIAQAAAALKPGGWIFLEIGDKQAAAVQDLLKAHGFAEVEVRKDLAGKDRVALARRPGGIS